LGSWLNWRVMFIYLFFPTFFPQEGSRITRIPEGLKDLTPSETEKRNLLIERFRETLDLWGYREVSTPTIEFETSLSKGIGTEMTNSMFKLQDVDGEVIALRAEMTAPVARMTSTRLGEWHKPIRIFYIGPVFKRTRRSWDDSRETLQGGLELIGVETPYGEVEVLTLLKDLLRRLKVPEATIDVGHSALLKELAELFPERTRRELMNQIRLRDKNRLTKLLEEMEKPEEKERVKLLIDLLETTSIGEAASITSNIKELKQYSSELEEIADWLKELGVADGIGFDITLIRNLEYYTGLIFEVITPSIGVPIGGGGRYDNLMEKFGAPATKAIGFALDMDKVSRATGLTPPKKVRALIFGDPRIAYRIGRELRGKGIPAAVNWGQDGENLLGFAETWGYTHIVKAESVEEASILKLGKDGWTKLSVREIPDEISQATGDS